jgi:NAD(P)H dehydrogenase (quinone)
VTRTLVVYAHPVAESFTAAARDAVLRGLDRGGHETRLTDLHAEAFDPVFSATDHALHRSDPSTKPDVARHADDLRWCESLVLVYPTWWAGQPAMLKGWIDRVWINGVAWSLPEGANRLRRGLPNIRTITVVTSHGSSKLINTLEGEPGKRVTSRSLRPLCNRLCRSRWIALYGIDRSTDEQRQAFIRRVEEHFAR